MVNDLDELKHRRSLSSGDEWTTVVNKKRVAAAARQSVQFAAATTVAAVLAVLPAADAQPTNFERYSDPNFVVVQLLTAAAIWALHIFGQHLLKHRNTRRHVFATVMVVISCAWVRQVLGGIPPAALLWQQLIALQLAGPTLVVAIILTTFLAVAWRSAEKQLFQKALRS